MVFLLVGLLFFSSFFFFGFLQVSSICGIKFISISMNQPITLILKDNNPDFVSITFVLEKFIFI